MQSTKVDVWGATIEDKPGGLHAKLQPLADAGANLAFVIARRSAARPGEGEVFVTPLTGSAQTDAAQQAGFKPRDDIQTLRIEADDRPGLGAELTRALAQAGLNMHGLSAAALDGRTVAYISFDSPADADKAAELIGSI